MSQNNTTVPCWACGQRFRLALGEDEKGPAKGLVFKCPGCGTTTPALAANKPTHPARLFHEGLPGRFMWNEAMNILELLASDQPLYQWIGKDGKTVSSPRHDIQERAKSFVDKFRTPQ